MKKLVREYWKLILIFSIPYLFIIVASVVKVNYDVVAPASITRVSETIDVDNNSRYESNINVVSVYSYSKVSLLNYLMAKINKNVTVSKTYEYEVTDYNLVYTSGVIQKRVSIYNAIISAYKKAGYDDIIDENSYKGYVIHTLSTYAPSQLKLGDIIVKFNGIDLKGLTGENEFEKVASDILYERKTYPITVERTELIDGKYVTNLYDFQIASNYFYNRGEEKYIAFGIYTYEYIILNIHGTLAIQLDHLVV